MMGGSDRCSGTHDLQKSQYGVMNLAKSYLTSPRKGLLLALSQVKAASRFCILLFVDQNLCLRLCFSSSC